MSPSPPRIVIVGGGAGGLELATRLGNTLGRSRRASITLVDASPTHVWKPLLHEVATGVLDAGTSKLNYFGHGYEHHYAFEFGALADVRLAERRIVLAPVMGEDGKQIVGERRLAYDYLVLAIGAQTNDFHTPGVAEFCHVLDDAAQAEALHRALLLRLYQMGQNSTARLSVAIVGGGATGVELAAEMQYVLTELARYGERALPASISLIDAADRLLSGGDESVSQRALEAMRERDVEIVLNQRVVAVDATSLELADGRRITADVKVWASGIRGHDFMSRIDGLETTKQHQVVVDATLRSTRDDRVFAMGDCSYCTDTKSKTPVPATAQAAHQQAETLARSLCLVLDGKPALPFVFSNQGTLVSLGKASAIGNVITHGRKRSHGHAVHGAGAKLLYVALYRMHQATLHGWWRTLLLMLSDRLRRASGPAIKLHW